MRNLFWLIACLSGVTVASCNVLVKKPQPISVTCQTVKPNTLVDSSEFVGSLEAVSQTIVKAENDGKISQILVNSGEKVTAGHDIFLLDTGSQIKAPISGVISEISVNLGEFITKGQVLTNIINNETLVLQINLPIERLSQLKIGLPVEIINSSGNVSLKSQINFISPNANRDGQSILAKANVRNNGSFRDNQLVQARVIWEQKPGFLIPTESVSRVGRQNFIFVIEEQKRENAETTLVAKQRLIELGNFQEQKYEVVSGLEAGEKVVVGSNKLVQSRTDLDKIPLFCR